MFNPVERFGRRSFRSLLLAGTLGTAVALSALLIGLMFYQSRLASRQITEFSLRQRLLRVEERVIDLLESAEMTAMAGAELTQHRTLVGADLHELMANMVSGFQQRPVLTYLGYALAATGEYALLERRADGEIWLREYRNEARAERSIRDWRWEAGQFVRMSTRPGDDYDPRRRPHYEAARLAERPVWTPVYTFVRRNPQEPDRGCTFAVPITGPDGRLTGVWDADFDTRALCEFLRDLRTATDTQAFVVEEKTDGTRAVVAHPDAMMTADAPGGATPAEIASRDPSFAALLRSVPGTYEIRPRSESKIVRTTAGTERMLGLYARLDTNRFPRWIIAVTAPERGYETFTMQGQWLLVGMAAVFTVAAGGGALWVARRLARPVERLRASVEVNAGAGDPVAVGRVRGPREFVELAEAYNRMVATISTRRKELEATNEKLTAFLDHIPGVVWALGSDERYVLQNRESRERHGDCRGKTFAELGLPAELRAMLEDTHRRALAGETVGSDVLIPGNAGPRTWRQLVAPFRRGAGGPVAGVIGLSFDVTEQRAVEQALRASERRVRLHLENTPLAVIDWTADFRIGSWNLAAVAVFGWNQREAIGQPASLIMPESELTEWQRIRDQRGTVAGADRSYLQNRTKDGRTIDCEWYNSVLRDEAGRYLGVSSLVLDVTQRMGAERMFRESEARFRAAFQNSPLAIAIYRLKDEQLVDVNERWAQMFGFRREEVLGRTTAEIGIWESIETRAAVFAEVAADREVRDRELRLRDRHGVSTTLLLSGARLELAGEDCGIFISHDISGRKEAENELLRVNLTLERRVAERTAELAATNARLRELDRLKSEFLATMSHELRTPLNSIIGFSDILRQELPGPLNAEQRTQLELVNNSARHLLSLINDLLDLSRIEAGRVELVPAPVRLAEVLREIENTLAPLVEKKRLAYRTVHAPGGEDAQILSDRKRVFQVLLNLANNAVKFTEQGSVTVTCQPRPDGTITITVRDTGIGIRPDQFGRLFEAFRQLDGSRRRAFEGTGLGLHLVKKLLALLGGEISVESEVGRGSCFTVRFPPALAPSAPPNPPVA